MSMNVTEIEPAIEKLPPSEISRLSQWFAEFEARVWDKKIERDLQNGEFKSLIQETEKDFDEGKCQPL
jgi:hypothetical protein